jgi:hypothetical protein
MTDEHPTLSPDFDLDAWIDGTCGITTAAKIVQRGDLIADRIELEEELRAARQPRQIERGVNDRGADSIRTELDELNAQIWASSIVVTMRDSTTDRRRKIRAEAAAELGLNLKDDAERYHYVLLLVEIADSIIKVETPEGKEMPIGPAGFGWERLEKIRERCGDAALIEVIERYREMTSSAPAVQAPFSPSSSSARGGTTSPSSSGRRASGASRRG